MSSNPTSTPQIMIIGDSRVVGMAGEGNSVNINVNGVYYFAKVGEGSRWLNANTSQISTLAENQNDIVISMGVNDISNVGEYQKWLEKMLPTLRDQGKNVYFTSVDPVGEVYSYGTILNSKQMNAKIDAFNRRMQAFCGENNIQYIDTAKHVKVNHLTSQMNPDGLHYQARAAQSIRDFIIQEVKDYVTENGYPEVNVQNTQTNRTSSPRESSGTINPVPAQSTESALSNEAQAQNLQLLQNAQHDTYQNDFKIGNDETVLFKDALGNIVLNENHRKSLFTYLNNIGIELSTDPSWTKEQQEAVREFIQLNYNNSADTKLPEELLTFRARLSGKPNFDIDAFAAKIQTLIGRSDPFTFGADATVQEKFETIYNAYKETLTKEENRDGLVVKWEEYFEEYLKESSDGEEQAVTVSPTQQQRQGEGSQQTGQTQAQMRADSDNATNTLKYVANSTPTYFYDFLSRCPAIDDERRPSKWMNSRELIEYLNKTKFTEEEKAAIQQYVNVQSGYTRTHWSDIRTRGGKADSPYNQASKVIEELQKQQSASNGGQQNGSGGNDENGAESGNATPTTAQPQGQTGNGTPGAGATQPDGQQKSGVNESGQSKQPPYPHLPQNLISAVTNNPEKMYKYFRRHSKSCGDFKKADVLGKDGKPDAAKMLGWLNEHYPDFKESRKQKIDKACFKYDKDHYVYPPLEGNSQSATILRGQIKKHMINTYNVVPANDSEQEMAAAYRTLSSAQRDRLNSEVEKYVKENQIEVNLYYGHASGGVSKGGSHSNANGEHLPKENVSDQQMDGHRSSSQVNEGGVQGQNPTNVGRNTLNLRGGGRD